MNAYPVENDKCTADVELEALPFPVNHRHLENHLFGHKSLECALVRGGFRHHLMI